MKTIPSRILLVALLLLALPAAAKPPQDALPFEEPNADAVKARLVAESVAIEPGGTLLVGVHLSQDPGWHTYWKNGGDAGLPTTVDWKLPEGFTVGELQWPTPHRYVEAGDLVTYGYAGDVVLLAELRAPAELRQGDPVRIGAHVEWLMCKSLCIPGDADVTLDLAVGGGAVGLPERDRLLIEASRARLPRSAEALEGVWLGTMLDLSAVPAGQRAHAGLRLEPVGAEPDWTFFPEYDEQLWVGEPTGRLADGALDIALPLELEADAETVVLRGVLSVEPKSGDPLYLSVEIPVPVAAEDQAVEAQNAEFFEALLVGAGGGGLLDGTPPVSDASEGGRSLAYYLLFALIGGIILNVMPCVLPVLSLKVMSFVRHAGEDRSVQLKLGLVFALGVLASFLALALVVIGLQAAGDQIGWGFQFQNPVFVVAMATIVFAFGLSLFGVFEIVLPLGLGAGGGTRSAYGESFLNGILATALATPCTAPFLGTALGFAFTQPAGAILAIFLTIGVGLALPYVLLALNPAWLRFVPKPGPWMERFKQAMGFLLMATLVWLLWVLSEQLGGEGVVWTLAFLTCLGFALWLYGSLLTLNSGNLRRTVVLVLVAAISVGAWIGFLGEPLSAEGIEAARERATSGGHGEEGEWIPFSVEGLEQAVADGNTVFIDFTAAWCWTCKVNEKAVLAKDEVREKLSELGVVTMLGDWTNRDPVITQVLRRFDRSGVPFYAVFPAGRLDEPIVLPEVITVGLVLEALEKAGPSRPAARAAL